jgi:hypothetical protein
MQKLKILIIGHAQHGKDTSAEIINSLFGYSFDSSSVAAARIFLYEKLKDKYGYGNFMECFEDRVNKRKEWHDEIKAFNAEDPTRLAREILKENDVYVGMRSNIEIVSCVDAGVFDLVIGIYDYRKPLESPNSFDINLWERTDIIIPNSQGIPELRNRLQKCKPLFIK